MRRFLTTLAILAALPTVAMAQSSVVTSGASTPATCRPTTTYKPMFYKNGTGLYVCTATNTWTLQTPTTVVSTTGSPANGNLAKFSGASTVTNGDLSGDVSTAGTLATTIVSDSVSYAKMQNVSAASRLLGRGDSGAGDPQEITIGSGLTMTGTTLSGTGTGGYNTVQEEGSGLTARSTVNFTGGQVTCVDNSGASRTDCSVASTITFGIIVDGAGTTLTTGAKGFIRIPVACTITRSTVLSIDGSASSGSIVFDLWKDTYANFPPTIGDTITASAKPTLSSANKSTDATLTGWTTAVAAGDVIGFNIDSVSSLTRVLLEEECLVN